jgi:hypothetical protein
MALRRRPRNPLTLDPENVLPAFLSQVRMAVFNRMRSRVAPQFSSVRAHKTT